MVQVRLLTDDDYNAFVSLLSNKNKISNIPTSQWDWQSWEQNFYSYVADENSRIIGCFDNDRLTAFVIQKFLKYFPCWVMALIGQETTEKFLQIGHGEYLNLCLLDAVRFAEERKIYEVMYSVPAKWLRTTARTQPTSPVWSRYNVYIDALIPANTMPEYYIHKYICGEAVKNHHRAVKRCSLKTEHRSFEINT